MSVAEQHIEEPRSRLGTPVWELARLYPAQGQWTEEDYLALHTNQLIEFTRGVLEFLEVPTRKHQLIVAALYHKLYQYNLQRGLGEVHFAPLRIRVAPSTIREPDVLFLANERLSEDTTIPPEGADLAMEVVSPSPESRERDLVKKRHDYALAGVAEYWIVDPANETITVLALDGDQYETIGEYHVGQIAESRLLPGFEVDVSGVFPLNT